jgi:hypothetical protein
MRIGKPGPINVRSDYAEELANMRTDFMPQTVTITSDAWPRSFHMIYDFVPIGYWQLADGTYSTPNRTASVGTWTAFEMIDDKPPPPPVRGCWLSRCVIEDVLHTPRVPHSREI